MNPGAACPRRIFSVLMLLAALGGCRSSGESRSPEPENAPAAEPSPGFFLPAEFQPQEALLLGAGMLGGLFPEVLGDIVAAVQGHIRVVLLVASDQDQQAAAALLRARGLDPAGWEFKRVPIMTMWVRDFGPLTVVSPDGSRRFVDFVYRERRGNALDNDVPGHLAPLWGVEDTACPILLEGGDLLTNGLGLGLGSTRILARNSHYLGLEPDSTVVRFAGALGFESVNFMEPLVGETTGHLDMFSVFLRPDLLVIGACDAAVDSANAALLDRNASRLEGAATLAGPLQVARVPMPPHDDDIWRTYTNIVFANDVVLVPVYPDRCPDLDQQVLAMYRRWLPEHKVVDIDASALIRMRGALRCVTMNVAAALRTGS